MAAPLSSLRGGPSDTFRFHPGEAGTLEIEWQRALSAAPWWTPEPSRVVIVSPHPDDETFGAGGLMAMASRAGASITLVSVTDGEAAKVGVSPAELAELRRAELAAALDRLGVELQEHLQLGLPDGGVQGFADALDAAISDALPEGALLVGPFEGDFHPDHVAVGEACLRVARRRGALLARYPIWGVASARGGGARRPRPPAPRPQSSPSRRQTGRDRLLSLAARGRRPGGPRPRADLLRARTTKPFSSTTRAGEPL